MYKIVMTVTAEIICTAQKPDLKALNIEEYQLAIAVDGVIHNRCVGNAVLAKAAFPTAKIEVKEC